MIEQMVANPPRFEPVPSGYDHDDDSSVPVYSGPDADSVRGRFGRGARIIAVTAHHTFRFRYLLLSGVGFTFGTAFTIYSATIGK